jgi:hypothetical protein
MAKATSLALTLTRERELGVHRAQRNSEGDQQVPFGRRADLKGILMGALYPEPSHDRPMRGIRSDEEH